VTRYLVTGGAGFIGSHLVERLITDGHHVAVLDDFSTGNQENLARWKDEIDLVRGSVNDADACARALRGVDFVLHQAARPSVPRSVRDPEGSHLANASGTLTLLVAARDAGVRRVVYASSSSIYGDTPELPKHEGLVPRPRSPYAASKLAGEHYCAAFFHAYGLETITLRYFNVFGPRQDPSSQYSGVVARFIDAAISGEAPEITGDGGQTRDFTFVANVVNANLLACDAPSEALGLCFNVGCGQRTSVNQLWETIAEIVGIEHRPRYRGIRAGDVRDSLASMERATRYLGYHPVVSLRDGLRETIAFARDGTRSEASPRQSQTLHET
jgi:nucleoside-diphosphate-sugar epimerase